MTNIRHIEAKLTALHMEFEDAGADKYALKLAEVIRDVRCAAAEEINVTSWDEFQRFWERNRGEQLVFILIDKYGPDHAVVNKVKELVTKAVDLDRELHDLYMQMKGKGGDKKDEEEGEGGEEDKKDDAAVALDELENEA